MDRIPNPFDDPDCRQEWENWCDRSKRRRKFLDTACIFLWGMFFGILLVALMQGRVF